MKIHSLLAAAAVTVACIPVPAFAESMGPVMITQSHVDVESTGGSNIEPGNVMLTFVNRRSVPATRVSFALVAHGERLASLHATGTFSKGVAINESFQTTSPERHQKVVVSSVTFADGTTWQNPDVPRGTAQMPYSH